MILGWKLFAASAAAAGALGAHVVSADLAGHRIPIPGRHAPALPGGAGCSTPVGREVCRQTADPHVRSAMLLGALLEGGNLTGPWACGDGGLSCGPFQILRPAHPGVSRAEAQSPRFAVGYMLPAYRTGCASVPAASWWADPRGSAATCAYRAERPARMYPTARVAAAWARLRGQR